MDTDKHGYERGAKGRAALPRSLLGVINSVQQKDRLATAPVPA
jgi:hypothetical protein